MEWRDAAISTQIDQSWNNLVFLKESGFLSDHEKLAEHADIPLTVLERSEKASLSSFPALNQQQVDTINSEWHTFQVDLAGRSKYVEYRLAADSGHRMPWQKPEAIADAIRDVVKQVRSKAY